MDEKQAQANIDEYTQVIAAKGKNTRVAYNNRAIAYVATGRPELALADLAAALASGPEPGTHIPGPLITIPERCRRQIATLQV